MDDRDEAIKFSAENRGDACCQESADLMFFFGE